MTKTEFWLDGARLAVTVVEPSYPDLPQNSFYEYGVREGIPRMLELFDKHGIKVTSFMIGQAVDTHPELAAAGTGPTLSRFGARRLDRTGPDNAPREQRTSTRRSRDQTCCALDHRLVWAGD